MSSGIWAAIITSAGVILVSFWTVRANRRAVDTTHSLEARKVDLDEFNSLRTELREQLDDARERITALEANVAEERKARAAAEARAVRAEERAEEAERKATAATRRLLYRIEQLEQVLRANGIPVPPPDS